MAESRPARMTVREFLVAKASDPQRFHQLIDGVVVPNQPRPRHQRAAFKIAFRLQLWIEAAGFGEVSLPLDIEIDDHNLYCPDLLWAADVDWFEADREFFGMPDLIVEVRSPKTWNFDRRVKKRAYERLGLPELWLIDTFGHEVLVHRRSARDVGEFDVAQRLGMGDALTSPQLPGFELELRELFRS